VRSSREIKFRLLQEARNLGMLARAPGLDAEIMLKGGLPRLPAGSAVVESLRGSDFAQAVVAIADEILAHRFPVFDRVLDTGADIRWRRDYARQIETGADYFRLIPYLDSARAGDHKFIWELNRHQHLVALAQAHGFTGRPELLAEIAAQLEGWLEQNPFPRGMNWVSALEVAFRASSWIWVLHLVGERLDARLTQRVIEALYRHGRFLQNNLSVYFSPNTHLLGEAVVLHALGVLFPQFPEAGRWEQDGAAWVERELLRQVRDDGSHFEQSSYYHVYALDMFLFHAVLRGGAWPRLERMAEYLSALLGPSGSLQFVGDDDGGRWFHPYGPRDRFGRATLATCGVLFGRPEWIGDPRDLEEQAVWWLGPRSVQSAPARHVSRLFAGSGNAILVDRDRQVIAKGGPLGRGRAGHSHSDCLSVIARTLGHRILIDPGTFTYVGDARERERFRGTAAHNTIRVDGLDQADPFGPFGWAHPPATRILEFQTCAAHDFFDAECRYRGITHRRRVLWIKPDVLLILDDVDGTPGEHDLEQFWHLGGTPMPVAATCFGLPGALLAIESNDIAKIESGWISPVFGSKSAAAVIRVARRDVLPSRWAAALIFGESDSPVSIARTGEGWELDGRARIAVAVPDSGVPQYG
jgi:Heparinase II/III-like protein/Heparinase II/III N-terminus